MTKDQEDPNVCPKCGGYCYRDSVDIGIGGILALDENLKRQSFQKAYEKNMECRMKINQPNPAYVNIVCGNVPNLRIFK